MPAKPNQTKNAWKQNLQLLHNNYAGIIYFNLLHKHFNLINNIIQVQWKCNSYHIYHSGRFHPITIWWWLFFVPAKLKIFLWNKIHASITASSKSWLSDILSRASQLRSNKNQMLVIEHSILRNIHWSGHWLN